MLSTCVFARGQRGGFWILGTFSLFSLGLFKGWDGPLSCLPCAGGSAATLSQSRQRPMTPGAHDGTLRISSHRQIGAALDCPCYCALSLINPS